MDNLLAYNKFAQLPKALQSEVIDFIEFLLTKEKKKIISAEPEEDRPSKNTSKRILGALEGMITVPDDFNEPLEDLKDYM